jgi:hypothetical protein
MHTRPTTEAKGELARLLETEARIEGLLASARREASALVQRARQEAADRLAGLPAGVEREAAAVATQVMAESQRTQESLRQAAAQTVARLNAVSAEEVAALARWVLTCAIAGRIEDGARR